MSFIQTHLEKIDQYLNDHPKVKFLLPQVILIILVLSIIFYFSFNASSNLSARGINTGFGFLSNKASFDIQFSLIEFNSSMTYGRAYLVGLLNTILVSVIGILFATILGFIFGILRLSSNPLASGTTGTGSNSVIYNATENTLRVYFTNAGSTSNFQQNEKIRIAGNFTNAAELSNSTVFVVQSGSVRSACARSRACASD